MAVLRFSHPVTMLLALARRRARTNASYAHLDNFGFAGGQTMRANAPRRRRPAEATNDAFTPGRPR
jgi:hypothetical protein